MRELQLFRKFLISIFFIGLLSEAHAQASFVSARHETLSQRDIDVQFNQGVSFSGAPTATGWTVTVNGTTVPITAIGTFGPNTVRIQFDASAIVGHGGTQPFLKPGEIILVSYNATGNLSSTGGVN
ncbi:MAG: hypothetical protein ACK5XL_20685, partial [Cyclobacteriaceae bacterium]